MLDKFGFWNLVVVAFILVVEWWLPRQTRFKANSIIELITDFIVATSLATLAIYFLIKNWRNNGH